jgi:hypothetical protein
VRTLSGAGVRNPWHRGLFLTLVLPVAYFGSITVGVLPVMLLASLSHTPETWNPAPVGLLLAIETGLCIALFVSGLFTRWMVAAVDDPAQSPFGDASEGSPRD